MTGAILGDIAGSRFEFSKPSGFNYKKVELFGNNCFFTDDTVLTIATKYALLNDVSYAKAYGKFGRMYRDVGYGTMFQRWLDGHQIRRRFCRSASRIGVPQRRHGRPVRW